MYCRKTWFSSAKPFVDIKKENKKKERKKEKKGRNKEVRGVQHNGRVGTFSPRDLGSNSGLD